MRSAIWAVVAITFLSLNVESFSDTPLAESNSTQAWGTASGSRSNSSGAESESHARETVQNISAKVIQPVSAALMCVLLLATVLERLEMTWIPESLVIIVVGGLCGIALDSWELLDHEMLLEINAPLVNLAFLPIIIFESGFSLRQKDFAAQFVHILIFAVVGTFLAMGVVGALIYATGGQHGITDARTAFTYASLIAATDPVATLSTYSSLGVDPLLSVIVFGESTINDAVAIVVFEVMNSEDVWGAASARHAPPVSEIWSAIVCGILQKLSGSIVIGLLLGMAYTLVLRWGDMRHAMSFELLFIMISCYLTFSTAECAGMSGIIAVLFCGIFMGIYSQPHLSSHGSMLASFFLKQLATMADMGIFLLVGVDMVLVNFSCVTFSLWVMLFCLIARAAAVGLCGALSNGLKQLSAGKQEVELVLTGKHMLMLWHAGLRGGIALVLCLEIGDWVDVRGRPGTKQELINTTIVVIVVFLLVFGGSTAWSLRMLGIQVGMEVDEGYLYDRSLMSCIHRCLHSVHHRWLAPVLFPADTEALSAARDGEDVEPLHSIVSAAISRHRGHYWFVHEAAGAGSSDEDDHSE